MVMDEGLDTGDMLLWEETEIKDEDNAETLAKRLSYMGASLLVKTLRGLKNNTIRPIPQTGDATYAPIIRKEHGKVKWSLSAREIFNLVRGTYPWPGAYCFLNHDRLTVLSARVADEDRRTVPGRIEKVEGEELRVGTGRGILSLLEVKPEGKRVMTAGSFAHGRHITGGMSFATQ
jgi:methionyl-tRNA formyltransferase